MAKHKKLSEKQKEFCELYVVKAQLNFTDADIAEKIGCSEKTIYNFLRSEHVQQYLNELRESMKSDFLNHLTGIIKQRALQGDKSFIDLSMKYARDYGEYFGIKAQKNISDETNEDLERSISELEEQLQEIRCFYEISGITSVPLLDKIIHALAWDRERLQMLAADPGKSEELLKGAELHKEMQSVLCTMLADYPSATMTPVSDGAYLKVADQVEDE